MKLMLVGYAARGKTTLLQKISEKGQRGVQENWALQRFTFLLSTAYNFKAKAFCMVYLSRHCMGWFPLGLRFIVEDEPSELLISY